MADHSSILSWEISSTEAWKAAIHGITKSRTRPSTYTLPGTPEHKWLQSSFSPSETQESNVPRKLPAWTRLGHVPTLYLYWKGVEILNLVTETRISISHIQSAVEIRGGERMLGGKKKKISNWAHKAPVSYKLVLAKGICHLPPQMRASQVVLVVRNLLANAGNVRDTGSIPGSGRSPGGEHGSTLQYSCLENLRNRGAWRATAHGVTYDWSDRAPKRARILSWILRCCSCWLLTHIEGTSEWRVSHFLL